MIRLAASSHGLRQVVLPRWAGERTGNDVCKGEAVRGGGALAANVPESHERDLVIDPGGGSQARDHVAQAGAELQEYFAGRRRAFAVALDPDGTPFLRQVWRAVAAVPFGQTRSYGEIARLVGVPDAARAVGRANAINPVAPFVACHRIVGSDGSLTGYGPGLPLKWRLLRLEDALPADDADYDAWIARVRARMGTPTREAAAGDATVCGLYLGVRRTRTYCRAGCERSRAHATLPARLFATPEEAAAAGFAPCSRCQPTGAGVRSAGVAPASLWR